MKPGGPQILALFFALLLFLSAFPPQVQAEEWTTYKFGEVSIQAPASWQISYRKPGREIHLTSPDGVYSLLAFWWFPDEPLLGYSDIVAHEEFSLAGRRAMMITSDFPQHGTYGLAFLDPRQDGTQFVMNLEFADKDFDKAAILLDELLSRLRYGGTMGGASRQFGQSQGESGQSTQGNKGPGTLIGILAARLGSECAQSDLDAFRHASRSAFDSRDGARLRWVIMCNGGRLPVFGTEFAYDPRMQTNDFFYPLYLEILEAMGGQPFAIVSIKDDALITISADNGNALTVDVSDLPGGLAGTPITIPGPATGNPEEGQVGDIQVAEIGNIGAVVNGPSQPVFLNTPEPITILSIQTYHWNNGNGHAPGTIGILGPSGEFYGPWQAIGKPGQGGVPDAYWYVQPNVTLAAGKYQLVDSNPETWATNDAAGNKGFVTLRFLKPDAGQRSPAPPESDSQQQPEASGNGSAKGLFGSVVQEVRKAANKLLGPGSETGE